MRINSTPIRILVAIASLPLLADEAKSADSWTKVINDRVKRSMLHDASHRVRGDTGKWNDAARLQHAPPIEQKPGKALHDDWSDQLRGKELELTGNDDNWLLFRTRQLDDNDRVWVERIERRGNQFVVTANQAIWQGRYFKNFTYFNLLGVNLGKLEPGNYEAKWIIKPLAFDKFEEPVSPTENWPTNERSAAEKPMELRVTFTIVEKPR